MMPIADLKRQYEAIKPEIARAINSVLDSGQYVLGSEVEAFEQEYSAFCGSRYAMFNEEQALPHLKAELQRVARACA
jgi:dTDP-4-amino-4,6-dideoxygalactose transaminase